MIIHVGSTNLTKIQAVRDTLILYPKLFPNPIVKGIDVDVPLYGHPKNLQETIDGAIDRAKQAFKNCNYSIGLEGGLMAVPKTRTGSMETNACAIYDGKEIYLGLGPAFEWPKKVTELILQGKADASLAFKQLGLTEDEKLGAQKGGITGPLTNNRITREEFMKYSIIMSLIHLEKPQLAI